MGGRSVKGSGMPSPAFQQWAEAEKLRREVFLQALNHQRSLQADNGDSQLRTGLALSGGGARGDFQVGALDWLRNQKHFGFSDDPRVPQVDPVAGCSVGSLNAAKLAAGP